MSGGRGLASSGVYYPVWTDCNECERERSLGIMSRLIFELDGLYVPLASRSISIIVRNC